MSRYQPYEKYKDSGEDWIGEVPKHWLCTPLKRLTGMIGGYAFSSKDYVENGIQLLKISGVYNNKLSLERQPTFLPLDFKKPYRNFLIRKGDVIMSLTGTLGKRDYGFAVLVDEDGPFLLNQRVAKFLPFNDEVLSDFLIRILLSDNYLDQLYSLPSGTKQANLSNDDVLNIKVSLPPLSEQKTIAAFLDYETGKIDQLIKKQQDLIALLEEKRQAVISHAVTKGLNPNVPVRDSGVEWLGKVPEHWEVKKLRHLGSLQNGLSKSGDSFGSGFPFVAYKDVYSNKVLPEEVSGLVQSSLEDKNSCSVKEGDIFFTRTSETVEEIGLTSVCFKDIEEATFAGFLIRFRPMINKLIKSFSRFYFQSELHRTYFVKEMNLVTRASLSQDLLKKLPVLLPPLDEQEKIGFYLDQKSKVFARLTSKAKSAIELMQERRTALISAAVTGKIDVRGWEEKDKGERLKDKREEVEV